MIRAAWTRYVGLGFVAAGLILLAVLLALAVSAWALDFVRQAPGEAVWLGPDHYFVWSPPGAAVGSSVRTSGCLQRPARRAPVIVGEDLRGKAWMAFVSLEAVPLLCQVRQIAGPLRLLVNGGGR